MENMHEHEYFRKSVVSSETFWIPLESSIVDVIVGFIYLLLTQSHYIDQELTEMVCAPTAG